MLKAVMTKLTKLSFPCHRPAIALAAAFALVMGAATPSYAVPVDSIHAEELIAMAPDLRKSLSLNANQQTLWGQVDGRSHAILRARASRREKLQSLAKTVITTPSPELRTLGTAMDAEDAAVQAEDKQLREMWLTVNDALDEKQRLMVAQFIGEQLERVESGPMRSESRDSGGEKRPHSGGRGGMGGMGGAGGGGAGGGANGINIGSGM
jgi:uncharacterized membrane protein YgcG